MSFLWNCCGCPWTSNHEQTRSGASKLEAHIAQMGKESVENNNQIGELDKRNKMIQAEYDKLYNNKRNGVITQHSDVGRQLRALEDKMACNRTEIETLEQANKNFQRTKLKVSSNNQYKKRAESNRLVNAIIAAEIKRNEAVTLESDADELLVEKTLGLMEDASYKQELAERAKEAASRVKKEERNKEEQSRLAIDAESTELFVPKANSQEVAYAQMQFNMAQNGIAEPSENARLSSSEPEFESEVADGWE